jgi:hypothetical protein
VSTFEQSTARLVPVDDLSASQVVVVQTTPRGALAVHQRGQAVCGF